MAVHPSRTVVAVGEVSPHTDDHRWARTGLARPVDNEERPRSRRGRPRTEGACGPGRAPRPPGYAFEVDDRLRPLPAPAALVLAALGGLALDLAFPGTSWWPLGVAGIALLALAVRGSGARRGALLGLVAGSRTDLPYRDDRPGGVDGHFAT